MNDYIDRQQLLECIDACLAETDGGTPIVDAVLTAIKCAVEQMPGVDAVPVVHGHWLKNVLFYGTHTCSNCCKDPNHFECATGYVEILSDYCPNCGAKMDGERRTDDTEG